MSSQEDQKHSKVNSLPVWFLHLYLWPRSEDNGILDFATTLISSASASNAECNCKAFGFLHEGKPTAKGMQINFKYLLLALAQSLLAPPEFTHTTDTACRFLDKWPLNFSECSSFRPFPYRPGKYTVQVLRVSEHKEISCFQSRITVWRRNYADIWKILCPEKITVKCFIEPI